MRILTPLVLLLIIYFVHSQVIGIDLGTEFWKASLISPGKNLVIVENSRSGRKSYNGIAFLDGIRHFEYDAFTKRQKKPKASYFYLNKLIESLDSQTPLAGYHFENGTYYFNEGYDTISLEQLVGMILKNVKKYSSAQAGSDIKDAVLTVPAHWGFKARLALVNAAAIADLNALSLINENSAAAIHFAITRNDSDPVNIGFFNLGSDVLQVSIVQFFGTFDPVREKNIQSMKVLSHVSVPNMGGLQIDKVLADYIADTFKAKYNLDVRTNQKSWVKLLHKCSDLKEDLSANKQASIYIQGFINGIDLNMNVKRQIIEKSPIFQKINENLQLAVQKAGLSKSDIQSVEIIGGASRIPLVNKLVKQFFDPVEVGSHINGDQSMAFGAALRAANLSIAFRVKQLHFYDGHPQEVRAVIKDSEDTVLSQTILFNKDSEHGLKKEVLLDHNDVDIKISIYYDKELVHEYSLQNVSQWKERYNESQLNFTEKPKLVLNFAAHSVNFAELKDAYVNITLNTSTTKQVYEVIVQNVTIKNEEADKKTENQQSKTESQQPKAESQENLTGKSGQNEAESNSAQEKTDQKNDTNSEQKKSKKTRQRTRNIKKIVDDFKIQNKKAFIKVGHTFTKYKKYTKEQVQSFKEVIQRYEKHENYLKEKAKIRNDFESTLYSLKDDYENQAFITFSTQNQRQKLKESVSQQLAWLQENAWTAEKKDFEDHFYNVQVILNPIVNRSKQHSQRLSIYNQTLELLNLVYTKTNELKVSHQWVQKQVDAQLEKLNKTVQQIHNKLEKQLSRKPNQNVIFYNHQMTKLAEDLRDQYYLIKMTPRPKIVKKVEVEAPKEPTSDEKVDLDEDEQAQATGQEKKQQTSDDSNQQQQQQATKQGDKGEAKSGQNEQRNEQSKEDL